MRLPNAIQRLLSWPNPASTKLQKLAYTMVLLVVMARLARKSPDFVRDLKEHYFFILALVSSGIRRGHRRPACVGERWCSIYNVLTNISQTQPLRFASISRDTASGQRDSYPMKRDRMRSQCAIRALRVRRRL
jgi:hypothetical protein